MGRLSNAWAALLGRPIYAGLPPAHLLEIGPEDKLLLECEQILKRDQAELLNQQMTAWLSGGDARCAVLSGGLKIIAVRRKPNTERSGAERPTGAPSSTD